ncbi:MAG: DUF4367 domain-containing protein [Defluviitaleaceae bacterium]|nr:DUF4367 domain-containing protein [Defluviitaleaceae bacterium]
MDNQLRKDITELILRRAVIDAHEREMSRIPSNEELLKTHKFSNAHEARMKALFKREDRKYLNKKIFVISKKAAIIFLVMATALFTALLTDSYVQGAVRETIISWYERFTTLRFQTGQYTVGEITWFPDFIPEGFEVTNTLEFYIGRNITMTHPNGDYIVFIYGPASDTTVAVDNEFTSLDTITLAGTNYLVATPMPNSEHHSQVIWEKYGYTFVIVSGLDSAILLNIAISVSRE